LLWKKVAPRLSAGRVQSVATRLLVERERERLAFVSAEYADARIQVSKKAPEQGNFEAQLSSYQGRRIAEGRDFDPKTGKLLENDKVLLLNAELCEKIKTEVSAADLKVESVESKPFTSKPYPPFTTSTLQQEGSRKLRLSARRTMQIAQTLYENGFITYMRTDSTNLSDEALNAARSLIVREFGKEFVEDKPRIYRTQVKNAQEAHEAIRPAGANFTSMQEVVAKLGAEAGRLYELIWKRTVACQMRDSEGIRVSVLLSGGDAQFKASGKTITFPGYLRAYVEGSDDPEAELADQERVLPKLDQGEKLDLKEFKIEVHNTKAPARYTEGSLIKELERLGIGRPSTWATIVDVVLQRNYAFKKGTALVPSFLAMVLTSLMENYFTDLVNYSFTAKMEDDLDAISRGEADNLSYLKSFYLGNGHAGLKPLVEKGEDLIDPRIVCGFPIAKLEDGRQVEVRIGRFGPFLSDGTVRASLPDDLAPDTLDANVAVTMLADSEKGPQPLGKDPVSGLPVFLKKGRFGPYVQLGENSDDPDQKPKMSSLLKGMLPEQVDLETALKLLSLPRSLGKHPETGDDVIVSNGKFGPYVKAGAETRSLPEGNPDLSPITISLTDALILLKEPKRRGRAAAGSAAGPLKILGKHPVTGEDLLVKSGRFGPYVTDGKINASLPRNSDPQNLTIDDAVNLLQARAIKIAAEENSEDGGSKAPKKRRTSKAKARK
jgi:DNA topoisomerase I